MELINVAQISYSELVQFKFDILIAASGYETRSRYFSEVFLKEQTVQNKFVLKFEDRPILARPRNDQFFASRGFKPLQSKGSVPINIEEFLSEKINLSTSSTLSILIDYSSMTKSWYASVLKYFRDAKLIKLEKIILVFVYTPPEFIEPKQATYNAYMEPIEGYSNIEFTTKKTSLIVGLGYEKNRAIGLIEYLEIDDLEIYLFYTGNKETNKFTEKVLENNDELLARIDPNRQFNYNVENLKQLTSMLSSICTYLNSKQRRIIIAPLGPKPFTLSALILSISHPYVNIYRISEGEISEALDVRPDRKREFVICKAEFSLRR